MKNHFLYFYLSLLLSSVAYSYEPSPPQLKALYNSLEPRSISQHLAFYKLYPYSPLGEQALAHSCQLLAGDAKQSFSIDSIPSLAASIHAIVELVNAAPSSANVELSDQELNVIEKIASRLPNRRLKGYYAKEEAEVLSLASEEIDLSRGVLLSQMGNGPDAIRKIRSYDCMIDLMALQILAYISLEDPPEKKIRAINRFIFDEMGFRFPPHSVYAKDVDLYTFLPSVLDTRRGVCLGVSILYMALAQRLNLSLELITPPGHIYVRYRDGDEVINIETTARGIHMDSEEYLGIDTCALQQRNVKEAIGLAHFNQASVFWEQKDYTKALDSYNKAQAYLPEDRLVKELMAYNHLLQGHNEEGTELLKKIVDDLPEHAVSKDTIPEDFLNGAVGIEGIETAFMQVDETRASLLEKRKALEEVLRKYPRYRGGLYSLAITWLQLHRAGEAIEVLNQYHTLDSMNPSVEYFLAALYAERLDYNKAWEHLRQAEKIVKLRNHHPQALDDLRLELKIVCPE